MGRRPEYHITYRKQRDDYRVAVPDGHGGRKLFTEAPAKRLLSGSTAK